jgi:hypothetical protein
MNKKTALLSVSLLVLAALTFVPVAGLSAGEVEDGDGMMYINETLTSEPPLLTDGASADDGSSNGGNNLFYDCLLVLIIALAMLGGLHLKAHPDLKLRPRK